MIKHGIKATGMPAWGKSMEDEYIWGLVAFVQQLPKLDTEAYQALVASSGGHSHGGGETAPHAHAADAPDHHHEEGEAEDHHGIAGHAPDEAAGEEGVMHTHADGTREMHPPPKTTSQPPAAKPATGKAPAPAEHTDDGHKH